MSKLFTSGVKNEDVLYLLEKKLSKFVKDNPSLKHFIWDPFTTHRKRYKKDLEIINRNLKAGRILDLGANPFHLTFCLKSLGYEVVGVDINPAPFKKFIQQNQLATLKCNMEIEKLPFKSNYFDLVILTEVFEHLSINPIYTLKEINRVLKPGGSFFLTTPNLYALHKILMFNLGMSFNDAYQELDKLNIYGYMGHIREYSTKEIKKILENTNFRIENVSYENYYSFFKFFSSGNILLKLAGGLMDILMLVNPYWRRHQAVIAKKIK